MNIGDKTHPTSPSATQPCQRKLQDAVIQAREAAIQARAAVVQAEIAKVDAKEARQMAEQAKKELEELIAARSRLNESAMNLPTDA